MTDYLSLHIEEIATSLLGPPNEALSNKHQLRFGNNGSVAVEIAGEKRGQWYDHENQIGGGPAEFVRHFRNTQNGAVVPLLCEMGIPIQPPARGKGLGEIVATYDYHDERGKLLFQVCRLANPKDFRQRQPDGIGGWKWKVKGVRQVVYHLPELIATPLNQVVYIVEGEKDADRARALGLAATCNPGGAGATRADGSRGKSKWRPEFAQFFDRRHVVVIPDNDRAGHDHAIAVATNLRPVAARIRIVELSGLPSKGDLSDWLDAGGSRKELERLIAATADFTPPEKPQEETHDDIAKDGLPVIPVRPGRRHEAADQGLDALRAAGVAFYQRDRSLVRVENVPAKTAAGEVTETPGVVEVSPAYLTRTLGRVARWQTPDPRSGKSIRIDPPRAVVEQIAEMSDEWRLPPLAGVIGTPTLRPDGSLLLAEGYDKQTGLVLLGAPPMPPIPQEPTRTQAEQALRLLDGLLHEFPFRDGGGDQSIDRAVALSELLTPVLRAAMSNAPMHLANAPQPGTGKSYLADLASEIATGERCAVVAFSPSPEETEKRVVGAALAGHPIIALDNASGTIEGDLLCQITERPLLQLRPLGTSKQIRAANTFTVLANGNNAVVADDMVRRTIECRLDANMESPETRSFKSNPLARIRQSRGAYIAACLIIARAYICAGMPGRLPLLASYEAWSDLARSPLVWLGRADPVASMASLRSLDPARQARAAVFKAWAEELGTGGSYLTADLIARATDQSLGIPMRPNLGAALMEVARDRRGSDVDPVRLGRWLGKAENNVAAGFKLTSDRGDAARPRWLLTHA
jgi:putative DNA primase/helicase